MRRFAPGFAVSFFFSVGTVCGMICYLTAVSPDRDFLESKKNVCPPPNLSPKRGCCRFFLGGGQNDE